MSATSQPAQVRSLLLALLLILGPGCGRENTPRRADDLRVDLRLEHQDLRSWASPDSLFSDGATETGPGSSDGGGGLWLISSSSSSPEEAVLAVAAVLVAVVVVVVAAHALDRGVNALRTTKVSVTPTGHPDYRQRLYWGDNTVWLPAELAGQEVRLLLTARGSWRGHTMLRLQLPQALEQPR